MNDALHKRLMVEIERLYDAHGKQLTPTAQLHWAEKLMPYAASGSIWQLMDSAMGEARFPALSSILEAARALKSHSDKRVQTTNLELSPKEKERSDRAAMISMLWFRNNYCSPSDDLGVTLARRVLNLKGKTDEEVKKILNENYPPDVADRWMANDAKTNKCSNEDWYEVRTKAERDKIIAENQRIAKAAGMTHISELTELTPK